MLILLLRSQDPEQGLAKQPYLDLREGHANHLEFEDLKPIESSEYIMRVLQDVINQASSNLLNVLY